MKCPLSIVRCPLRVEFAQSVFGESDVALAKFQPFLFVQAAHWHIRLNSNNAAFNFLVWIIRKTEIGEKHERNDK